MAYNLPLPAPYGMRRIPQQFMDQSWGMLPQHRYPVFLEQVREAVAATVAAPFAPVAVLPRTYGPFSEPKGAIIAYTQTHDRIRELQAAAAKSGSGFPSQPPPQPQWVFQGTPSGNRSMPGYHVQSIPPYRVDWLDNTNPWPLPQLGLNGLGQTVNLQAPSGWVVGLVALFTGGLIAWTLAGG